MGDLGERQAGALLGHEEVGGGAYELVASEASPQEASMVYREGFGRVIDFSGWRSLAWS